MKRFLVALNIVIWSVVSVEAKAYEQDLSPKAPGGEVKILDDDTCWGVIKALGMPAAPNLWAYDHSWYKNSKGQYVRASCVSPGKLQRRGYKSYVEVAPASAIVNEVSRKNKAREDYFKNRDAKAKATGVI